MIGDDIIALLKERARPMHVRQICDALDRDYMAVTPAITACARRELIVTVGTAGEYGETGVKRNAPMYALAGAEPLYKPDPTLHVSPMSDRIREALADGPLTAEELAQRVGLTTEKARKAAFDMAAKNSGIVLCFALYAEPKPKAPSVRESAAEAGPSPSVAGRITIGRGTKWGAGLA